MRLTLCIALMTAVAALGTPRLARGQSLGDVARKEEERRKDVKAPAKLYTNKDLGAPIQGGSPTDDSKPAVSSPEASKEAAKSGGDKAKDGSVKDQAYWVKRKK